MAASRAPTGPYGRAPKGDGGLNSRACLRIQFTYWVGGLWSSASGPYGRARNRWRPVEPLPDLMVEHLKVLLVEHLKVMAALSVEPAYASYLANYLPTHPNPRRRFLLPTRLTIYPPTPIPGGGFSRFPSYYSHYLPTHPNPRRF